MLNIHFISSNLHINHHIQNLSITIFKIKRPCSISTSSHQIYTSVIIFKIFPSQYSKYNGHVQYPLHLIKSKHQSSYSKPFHHNIQNTMAMFNIHFISTFFFCCASTIYIFLFFFIFCFLIHLINLRNFFYI